jgi:hypothetical protein
MNRDFRFTGMLVTVVCKMIETRLAKAACITPTKNCMRTDEIEYFYHPIALLAVDLKLLSLI